MCCFRALAAAAGSVNASGIFSPSPPLLDDRLEEELAGLVAGAHHRTRRHVEEAHPLRYGRRWQGGFENSERSARGGGVKGGNVEGNNGRDA